MRYLVGGRGARLLQDETNNVKTNHVIREFREEEGLEITNEM